MILESKKGNAVIDTILVVVVLFIFGIMTVLGYYIFQQFNLPQNYIFTETDANTTFQTNYIKYPALFDSLFITLLVVLTLLVWTASFMIDTHPIFFVVTILLLIFVFIVSAFLSNIYSDIMSDVDLANSASAFPMTNYVMDNFLMFIIVISFGIVTVLFAKNKMGSGT